MAEKNGNGSLASSFLNEIQAGLALSSEHLQMNWANSLPLLRGFLLGDAGTSGGKPAGRIVLTRAPRDIVVQLQYLQFGYSARYQGKDSDSLLEEADNDLDAGTVPWTPDYKTQQRELRRMGV